MPKFLMTVTKEVMQQLQQEADKRGIIIQELLRAVIIPKFFKETKEAR